MDRGSRTGDNPDALSEHDTTSAGSAVSDTTRDLPTQPPDGATASSGTAGAPAPNAAAPAVPAIGQEFGPVQLLSELGRGAAGVVFLGHHKLLARSVAVKCLMGGAGAWGEGGRRFVEEARAAAAVQHANLTQIYHADVVGDTPFLIMEYVDGPTLAGLLAHAGRMSPGLARGVMAEVAGAVGELHDRGLIHRDLKPSNVLLDRQGRVRVSDFGLAVRRATFASLATAAAEVAGTPAYMAPEMFEGRVSPRSDIYAMGVMMCQLIIGSPPFMGSFEEVVEEHRSKPLPMDALRGAGVDEAMLDLLERATHKQFLYRYKTAHEFRRALAALGTDAAESRRELARLIVSMRSGTAQQGAPATPASATISGEPGSSYAQTIARLATMKRERRSSSPAMPLPAPPPLTFGATVPDATSLPLPAPVAASAGESAGVPVARVAQEPYFVPKSRRPGILTALCITGIVAATFGLAGVLTTASMVAGLEVHPADALGGPRRWAVALDVVNVVLIVLPLVGSIAALRLTRWARPMLLAYAFAELAWQVFNVVLGFRVLLPRFMEKMQALKLSTPEQTQQMFLNMRTELAIMLIARCVLACAFAVAVVIVLHRPLVKLALGGKEPRP